MIGIDEVGRGPWAGPVVAAAVLLHKPVEGLKDSKKLSEKKRLQLDAEIRQNGKVGLGWVEASEIDEIGLAAAVAHAMKLAYNELGINSTEIIIDGNFNFLPEVKGTKAIIKADDKIPEVAAASIVAKVARDNYMKEMDIKYPGFGFASHVGYGTAAHKKAIETFGLTPLHRKSFKPITKLL